VPPAAKGTPPAAPTPTLTLHPHPNPSPNPYPDPNPNPEPHPNPGPNPNPDPEQADLQPHTVTRAEDFTSGRRVFHVHFGHGYVASLETREEEASQSQAEQALSSRTQETNVVV
jgi:hypothetical protein